MSRAMNLSLSEAEVLRRCHDAEVKVSAIETLASGGTHLVTVTGDGAAKMRRILRQHLIEGTVKRFSSMHSRSTQARPTESRRASEGPSEWLTRNKW